MLRYVMIVALTAGAASYSSPATSQPGQQPMFVQGQRTFDPETQRIVSFADLNIANPAGQKTLLRRVESAVNDICEVSHTAAFDVVGPMKVNERTCVRTAWDSANPQIERMLAQAQAGASLAAAVIVVGLGK